MAEPRGRQINTFIISPFIGLAIGLIGMLSLLPSNVALADNSAEKSAQLDQLRAKIQILRGTLESKQSKKSSLESKLRSTELKISKHSRSLRKLSKKLSRQHSKLQALQTDRRLQQQKLDKNRQALSQQIRASYAMGKQGTLKILLSQHNPSSIGRTLAYYDYFNRARAEQISVIASEITELESTELRISNETTQLEGLMAEQQIKKEQLESQYQKRHQVLIKVNADIGTKAQQLNKLLNDETQLSKLLEELYRALSDIPPDAEGFKAFAAVKGDLSVPSKGRTAHRFGSSRKLGKLTWQGMLIEAELGKEVHAIYHGRVAFANWIRNFGLLLIIDHGDGYMSLYGHNQVLYKDVGEWVEKDELIATIGNSGGRENPGLYFEIRHNGTPTNPEKWITQAHK